jgi:hypothetical protein
MKISINQFFYLGNAATNLSYKDILHIVEIFDLPARETFSRLVHGFNQGSLR